MKYVELMLLMASICSCLLGASGCGARKQNPDDIKAGRAASHGGEYLNPQWVSGTDQAGPPTTRAGESSLRYRTSAQGNHIHVEDPIDLTDPSSAPLFLVWDQGAFGKKISSAWYEYSYQVPGQAESGIQKGDWAGLQESTSRFYIPLLNLVSDRAANTGSKKINQILRIKMEVAGQDAVTVTMLFHLVGPMDDIHVEERSLNPVLSSLSMDEVQAQLEAGEFSPFSDTVVNASARDGVLLARRREPLFISQAYRHVFYTGNSSSPPSGHEADDEVRGVGWMTSIQVEAGGKSRRIGFNNNGWALIPLPAQSRVSLQWLMQWHRGLTTEACDFAHPASHTFVWHVIQCSQGTHGQDERCRENSQQQDATDTWAKIGIRIELPTLVQPNPIASSRGDQVLIAADAFEEGSIPLLTRKHGWHQASERIVPILRADGFGAQILNYPAVPEAITLGALNANYEASRTCYP